MRMTSKLCVTKFTIYYKLFIVIILMIGHVSNSIEIINNKDSIYYVNNIIKTDDEIPEVLNRYNRQTVNNGRNCKIPINPLHTTYTILGESETSYISGNFAEELSVLEIRCAKGYAISPLASKKSVCENGKWSETPQACLRTCPSLKSTETTSVKCRYNGIPLKNCINPVKGTIAELSCNPLYEEPSIKKNPVRVCKENRWTPSIGHCFPICGIKNPEGSVNIVNGQNVTVGDYPWQVGIYNSSTKEFLCGGFIIDQNIILTAAHCIAYHNGTVQPVSNYLVAAGKYFRKYDDDRDQFAQYSNILAIHANKRYSGIISMFAFDIAVLILSHPFTLSEALKPVCIELNHASQAVDLSPYDEGVVTGWGYTQEGELSDALKELIIPYIPYDKCFNEIPISFRRFFTQDKICGGYKNNAKSICRGDSGGALVFKNPLNDRYFVKGIVNTSPSTVQFACDSNQYSLYTYVDDYINFVRDIVALNQFRRPLECEDCTNEEHTDEINANTNRYRHECDYDAECEPQFVCIDFKCQNPCLQCGTNAECNSVQSHIPVCKCPKNYYGNPFISCQPENHCEGTCGTNASCELIDGIPACSCPDGMIGNPFISCRPFTDEDLCIPNPCGSNAICELRFSKTNALRPLCTCLFGYAGDPSTGCSKAYKP